MKSVRNIYKTGVGPSSSHTMGPVFAAKEFLRRNPLLERVEVTLYGSLAKTGRGHGTDRAIADALSPIETEIIFNTDDTLVLEHPNQMDFVGICSGEAVAYMRVLSIGGGEIRIVGDAMIDEDGDGIPDDEIYAERGFSEIAELCKAQNIRLSDYVFAHEDESFRPFLLSVWQVMCDSIREGLTRVGTLPGGLDVQRKAQQLYNQRHIDESPQTRENRIVCSYAFAVSEQNADGGVIVTAPTCGACGVLPAVLVNYEKFFGATDEQMLDALYVAAGIGQVIASRAYIAGATGGCQAEIGSASAMAAGALTALRGGDAEAINSAAAMALKNLLGLVCDPVGGLVEVPCVKRNVVGAVNALSASDMAIAGIRSNIDPDDVIDAMKDVGDKMNPAFKETGIGALAGTESAKRLMKK